MADEIAEAIDSKIKRRGRVSNKRDKRLEESKYHIQGQRWSDTKKLECATRYIVLGNLAKVEEFTGVPRGTIAGWRSQGWWEDMIRQIRDEHNDVIDSKMTGLLEESIEYVGERLREGDVKYDPKQGTFYKLPISARDATLVMGVVHDKRAMLRATPNSLSNDMSTDQRLERLAKEFARMIKKDEKVIEGEVVENDADSGDN